MRLIYTYIPDDIAAAVILNGVMVYSEDDDKGYQHEGISAKDVAERLAKALGLEVKKLELTWDDLLAAAVAEDCEDLDPDDDDMGISGVWTFDHVRAASEKKAVAI